MIFEPCPEHLTGRTRFRPGWFGSLILQVQFVKRSIANEGPSFDRVRLLWRDATTRDLGVLTTLAFAQAPNIQFNNNGAPIEQNDFGGLPGERKPH